MNQSSLDREQGGQQAVEVHSAMSSARRASSAISSASSSCIMHLGHWPALATSSIVPMMQQFAQNTFHHKGDLAAH